MLRRNIRLRREYIYRKSLEGKERLLYEKKLKIREALEEGKPIPTELRNEEAALRQEIDLEDEQTAVPHSTIDDEYANAIDKDPKILFTTSRDPSAPLTQFVKELKIVFPNSQRMNRGGQVISEIIETCRAHDFTDVILVHEHRGVPDGIIISHLPFGPTAYFGIHNVVTRHDIKDKKAIGTMSEAYPHLILENFSTKLGQRTANILKYLFPVPKPDTKRIITFANQSDYISFRHHIYEKKGGPKSIELKEIGPRFELRLYQIKLGTMDQDEAQTEWVSRPYMNTSKKRKFLDSMQMLLTSGYHESHRVIELAQVSPPASFLSYQPKFSINFPDGSTGNTMQQLNKSEEAVTRRSLVPKIYSQLRIRSLSSSSYSSGDDMPLQHG